jgi:hypothetical protein
MGGVFFYDTSKSFFKVTSKVDSSPKEMPGLFFMGLA